MAQVMIMVMEAGKAEHTCNLLADINKNGEVTKFYDYNGNELKINFFAEPSLLQQNLVAVYQETRHVK